MGRLDAFDVGEKKLTIQTEFFERPAWRIETKVYLGGELKKLYTDDPGGAAEEQLQARVNAFHQTKVDELLAALRARKS